MKKIVKIWLILLIFILNINVYAETNENLNNNQEVTNNQDNNTTNTTKNSDATLKDVYINEQKVVCTDYLCEAIIADNSIDEVVITYQVNDSKASVSKSEIKETLKEGDNEFKVTVTAEDGSEKTYTFKVLKDVLSTDSSLKKLVINGQEISLKENTLKYETTVSYATKKIEIEALTNSEEAVVEDFKDNKISYDFYEDSKEFKIKVKAEAGEISTYVIKITKREEKDATLKTLKITNASIDFESGVFDYEIKVLRNVETLQIEAIANDSDASVKINNPEKLVFGENIVTIEVNNDDNIKTYTIKVNKLDEEDQNLANLSSLKIEGYELDFQENKYEYDLKIGDVNFLNIEAIPKVEDSQVEITGNLDLVDGSIIKIKVIYDDETSNIYRINIIKEIKEEKDNNSLKLIIIIAIVFIIITIIVLVIIQIKNKNKKGKNKEKTKNKKKETKEIKKEEIISITTDEEIEDII